MLHGSSYRILYVYQTMGYLVIDTHQQTLLLKLLNAHCASIEITVNCGQLRQLYKISY